MIAQLEPLDLKNLTGAQLSLYFIPTITTDHFIDKNLTFFNRIVKKP